MRPPLQTTSVGSSRIPRRGVTLLEMLVTVALLLLMMIIIVQIFQSATGAITVSRSYAELDQELRRLDSTIRSDLRGVTCSMTPPRSPAENKGFFSYAENALSDIQDEDSDDTIHFTAQAPDGQPFTGRIWVMRSDWSNLTQVTPIPVTVTSQFAEIIYFQRGEKLYRRILLIKPTQSLSIGNTATDPPDPRDPRLPAAKRPQPTEFGFATSLFEPFGLFGQNKLVIGGNTLYPTTTVNGSTVPFVSWQGMNDISARPSKYPPNVAPAVLTVGSYTPIPNTLADLTNRENRFASPRFSNDYIAYASAIAAPTYVPDGLPDDLNGDGVADYYPTMYANSKSANLLNDSFGQTGAPPNSSRPLNYDRVAFPYIFPNAYSKPDPNTSAASTQYGSIHSLDTTYKSHNHNPLLDGDSIPVPDGSAASLQTWWGYPTWRETMAPTWLDPIRRINDPATATYFKSAIAGSGGMAESAYMQFQGLSIQNMSAAYTLPPQDVPFTDGAGGGAFKMDIAPVYEDDLLADNVRSFNVKAFDPNPRFINSKGVLTGLLPGYYDLGYIAGIDPSTGQFSPAYASGSTQAPTITGTNPALLDSFGHEGRMPPIVADNRFDPQYPAFSIGDNTAGVVRMRRVWDSWSTEYTNAPALPVSPYAGPAAGFAPVVPSYPPPYPAALRGIQIQIRVADPGDKHVKTLTIHHDFSAQL